MDKVIEKIAAEEGFSDVMYRCPTDYLTIGFGFNLEKIKMPREVADLWMKHIIKELHSQLANYSWFNDLNEPRKLAIYDMCYQMGVYGVMQFGNMIAAIREEDWDKAAEEMLDSRWARQTPNRANRNAEIMRSGEYGF